jgi:hypothetical protein
MLEGRANFTHSIRRYMGLRDDLATAVARKKFLSLKRNKPRPFSPWPDKYMTESSFFLSGTRDFGCAMVCVKISLVNYAKLQYILMKCRAD